MRGEDSVRELFRSIPDDPAAQERLIMAVRRMAREQPRQPPRRRAWLPPAAGAMSVLAVVLLIALVAGRIVPDPGEEDPAGSHPSSSSAMPAPPVAGAATPDPQAGADVPLTPQAAVAMLISLIPAPSGAFSAPDGKSEHGFVIGSAVYDDGRGESLLTVQVSAATASDVAAFCSNPRQICRDLDDGSRIQTHQSAISAAEGAPTRWTARMLRPDGLAVDVSELNSAAESGPPTRAEPPIAIDALALIASSPIWTLTIGSDYAAAAASLF